MSDFELQLDGSLLNISGHLVDSTDVQAHASLLQQVDRVNFSKIYSVSWLGLQKFLLYLASMDRTIEIEGVPANVYRIVILFPEVGEKIVPKSFHVELLESDGQRRTRLVAMSDMISVAEQQGCFVSLQDGSRVLGSLSHVCRPHFRNHHLPEILTKDAWISANKEQSQFWYEYTCFARTIVESCALAQRATTLLVEDALQQVLMRLLNLQQAAKVLDANFKDPRARTLMTLIPYVQQMSQSTFKQLSERTERFDGLARQMENSFRGESTISFLELVRDISCAGNELNTVTADLDLIGVEIGEKVFTFSDVKELKKVFEAANTDLLTDKNISSIRRKLKLPCDDGLTWQQTRPLVDNEFQQLQASLDKCVVALQGFDLIRQVITHRIRETDVLSANFDDFFASKKSWTELQDKILETAQDKLVTDQEKMSFAFFFPDRENRGGSKLNPGEVAFF